MNDPEQPYNYEKAVEKIKLDQQIYMIAPTLKKLDKGKQVNMNVYDFASSENDKVPKYTLYVVDSDDSDLLAKYTCSCVIVPQGQEKQFMFATEMGRQKLVSQVNTSRLVLVFLGAGHVFESLEIVKEELNTKILELSPSDCTNYNEIPIMSVGADIGQKSIVDIKAADSIEGFILQDVREPEGELTRQIIFEKKFD